MLSSKVKKMLVVMAFVLSIPFTCGGICDETAPKVPTTSQTTVISPNAGSSWRTCKSLSCTFKKQGNAKIKSVWKGARIELGSGTPLGGTWE